MPKTLTKRILADALFEEIGLNKRESKAVVDQFFEEIVNSLEKRQPVHLPGFGTFHLQRTKSNSMKATSSRKESVRSKSRVLFESERELLEGIDAQQAASEKTQVY